MLNICAGVTGLYLYADGGPGATWRHLGFGWGILAAGRGLNSQAGTPALRWAGGGAAPPWMGLNCRKTRLPPQVGVAAATPYREGNGWKELNFGRGLGLMGGHEFMPRCFFGPGWDAD
jgi:hypothetical protein